MGQHACWCMTYVRWDILTRSKPHTWSLSSSEESSPRRYPKKAGFWPFLILSLLPIRRIKSDDQQLVRSIPLFLRMEKRSFWGSACSDSPCLPHSEVYSALLRIDQHCLNQMQWGSVLRLQDAVSIQALLGMLGKISWSEDPISMIAYGAEGSTERLSLLSLCIGLHSYLETGKSKSQLKTA